MPRSKPYKAKSLTGAQRRVRELEVIVAYMDKCWGECISERKLLAKLAAEGPCFDNLLVICEAKKTRDRILGEMGLAPDGKFLTGATR